MTRRPRLGVVGTLVWDTIVRDDRPTPIEEWGGIAYALEALSAALPEEWEIVPLLKVGRDVRLAIHVGSQELPLVLTARVHRDDGERGIVLRFHELDREASKLLDAILDSLPIVEPDGPPAAPGLIVSEIIAQAH